MCLLLDISDLAFTGILADPANKGIDGSYVAVVVYNLELANRTVDENLEWPVAAIARRR